MLSRNLTSFFLTCTLSFFGQSVSVKAAVPAVGSAKVHIFGKIIQSDSGAPLGKILVTAFDGDATSHSYFGGSGLGGVASTSDGRFSFDLDTAVAKRIKLLFDTNFCGTFTCPSPWQEYATVWFGGTADFAKAISVSLDSQAIEVNQSLSKGAQIKGRILFADTQLPSNSSSIAVFTESGSYLTSFYNLMYSGTSSVSFTAIVPSGRYKLLAVPSDRYSYASEFYDEKSNWLDATTISVTAPSKIENLTILLDKGGVITGHVTDSKTGNALLGVDIKILTEDDFWIGYTATDENGNFGTTSLKTGKYHLSYSKEGYLDQRTTLAISVTAPQTTTDVSASLIPLSSLSLRVYLPSIMR